MNRQGRGWRWGARPALVALAGVIIGYFTNIVSAGNHSVSAVAGFVCAALAYFVLAWWDSVSATGTTAGTSVTVDQRIGTVRDGSVTAVETDQPVSGSYDLHQRVDQAECSEVRGIRRVPPGSAQERP